MSEPAGWAERVSSMTADARTVLTGQGSADRHRFGYWAAAFSFLTLTAFSTVPSPLYALYARRDGFSSLTITLVYAVYAVGVAVSLFFAGHLSDSHGRRPVLLAALGLDAASAVVFLAWPVLPGLFTARVICGLSVGVTSSTATAYLSELHAAHRPARLAHRAQFVATAATLGGFGLGALAAGLLAQYVAHPLTVPYALLLATMIVAAAGLMFTPETRPRHRHRPLPAYRPQRLSVPREGRAPFFSALLGIVLVLAVLGMFVSLAGTVLVTTLHHTSLALAGETVFLVFAAGTAMAAVTSGWPLRRLLAAAVALMIAGLAVAVTAAWLPAPSLALFLLGGAVVGAGGAAGFKSTLGVVVAVSSPGALAEALAAYFLGGYVGLSVPVIGLGIALQFVSTPVAMLIFSAAVTAALLAATPVLLRARGAERATG
jgi:MFS family permease